MSKENQNYDQTQVDRPMSDWQKGVMQLTEFLKERLPNKGDGLEFEKPFVPESYTHEHWQKSTPGGAVHQIYNAGEGNYRLRDLKYCAYSSVSFLNGEEAKEVMENIRQEGQKAVNRYKDNDAVFKAIVERVTTPTARHYTHDQAEAIRRYLGSFDDPQERDTRAAYAWETAKKAGDFQKYPEKWEKDALKEFNDIKNGLTNGQEENRHAHVRL